MSNTRIQAAAEVLPTPDREISPLERMQGIASVWMNATPEAREHALAASRTPGHEEVTALMTHQSPLSIAIQQHHKALAELDALGLAQVAAEEAHIAANRTDPQLAEAFEAADAAFNESCSRQSDAHEAVLSAPVLTLSDMQVKAAHLADTIQHTIHDASTMRKLLASVAPGQNVASPALSASDLFPGAVRRSALASMSMRDLVDLHGAAATLFDVIAGLANQPKFGGRNPTAGRQAVDSLHELLANCIDSVVQEARGRSPEAVADQDDRAWLLLRYEAEGRDTLSEIATEIALLSGRGVTMKSPTPTATASGSTLSGHVNELLGAYVAIEREQDRLAKAGLEDEASALGGQALETRDKIFALRDRSGNHDLIAARVIAEQMLLHNWRKLEVGEAIDWSHEDREIALPLLEAVADRTTGTVREHTRLALATIGVEIEPETADPLLALIHEHENARNAALAMPVNTSSEAEAYETFYGREVDPLFWRLVKETPNATTPAGALAALRFALHGMTSEDGESVADEPLMRAAMRFLDGRA